MSDQESFFNRRELLKAGGAGLVGMTLGKFMSGGQAFADPSSTGKAKKAEPKAQSIIHIFLPGGMASQETWDPKPFAPIEYRGEIKAIKTKLTGVRLGSLMPKTAQIADKITLCRAMTHGEADHDRGTHNMFTGHRPSPAILFASIGSVIGNNFGSRNNLPPYICVPFQPNKFAGSGYLSSATAPFSLGGDPARGDFKVRDLNRPKGVDAERFERRKKLLEAVNKEFAGKRKDANIEAMDKFYQHAYKLINSKKAREAFNIKAESKKMRDGYGRNTAGQRMLMARRLVESGARFVSMTYGGWDMHDRITRGMKRLVPAFDQAFAALIRDLDARDMLKSTLVMVTSEFGRTPKINKTGGRDHWPKVFSIAMAGGGIKRGFVYGSTDATAVEPQEDALKVEDWAHTVYHLAGMDADKKLPGPAKRPIPIVDSGKIVRELLA
ncbi:MAG: DUF1501 domain-containing protein [Planctomycetota bacterium]|nr:DUF1501 domain-containing protein [Planctomycetota bacterium]